MLLDCEGIPDCTQLDLLLPQTSDDPFSSPTIQQSIHFRCAEPPTPIPTSIRTNCSTPTFGPGTHTSAEWFNPAAFAAPPAYTLGDVGRNSVYGPPLQSLDLGLVRSFNLTERAAFQFRAEAFNALNKTNLGMPNRFVNTPQFERSRWQCLRHANLRSAQGFCSSN
jgi:hypothetical protein